MRDKIERLRDEIEMMIQIRLQTNCTTEMIKESRIALANAIQNVVNEIRKEIAESSLNS